MTDRKSLGRAPKLVGALQRPSYEAGSYLAAHDLLTEQRSRLQRLRRHNRYLHGWGVICGLLVVPATDPKARVGWVEHSETHQWTADGYDGFRLSPLPILQLRRTPDGRWYCFEVNPSPGFTYYQAATKQPIGEAIAQLLIGWWRR